MKLNAVVEGISGTHVVVKSFDSTDPVITVIPGYCWNLEGADKILGFNPWPYPGKGLYGMAVRASSLQPWPFRWGWADGKGHVGKPEFVYTPKQIKQFARKTETVDDVARLDKEMGYPERATLAITRDVVKSIKPGVIIDWGSTYTDNFEVIVNVPVQMYLLSPSISGSELARRYKYEADPDDQRGDGFDVGRLAAIRANNLHRRPSL